MKALFWYFCFKTYMRVYEGKWCYMMLYDGIWWMVFDGIWWYIWWYMMVYDAVWWYMMLYDAIWCYMMVYEGKWCYMMVYDAIWWYMVVHVLFWDLQNSPHSRLSTWICQATGATIQSPGPQDSDWEYVSITY